MPLQLCALYLISMCLDCNGNVELRREKIRRQSPRLSEYFLCRQHRVGVDGHRVFRVLRHSRRREWS